MKRRSADVDFAPVSLKGSDRRTGAPGDVIEQAPGCCKAFDGWSTDEGMMLNTLCHR
jgi:hypothetical protein